MPTVTTDQLRALSRAICAASGSVGHEAALVADHLVEANLTGHDSHGVGLLPIYVDNVRAGRLVPNRHAEVVSERGAVLVIEGNRGYGQVVGHEAMQLGMACAREHGVALLAIRNSFHLRGTVCARRLRLDPLRQRDRSSAPADALRRRPGGGAPLPRCPHH